MTNPTTGVTTTALSSTEQSAGTGLGTAGRCFSLFIRARANFLSGIMLGCMIAPWFNEKYGRRKSFMLLAVLGLIGTLIQAVSTVGRQYWVLIAGKIILNMSVGIASAVVGVYLSECAPTSIRGTLMSNYNIVQNVGYVLAAGTVYGVVARNDMLNWLLPICLQFVLPIVILATIPLLPESPRWLAGQGRLEEAASVIRSLRIRSDDYTDEKIWAELLEIQASYVEAREQYQGSGWLELFRGANLRRTLIAIGLQSLQQAQGVSFVSNYTVTTLISLGIQNVYTIVLVLYVVLLVTSLGAFYFPDKLGRRTRKLQSGLIKASADFQSCSSVPSQVPPGWQSLVRLLPSTPLLPVPWPTSLSLRSSSGSHSLPTLGLPSPGLSPLRSLPTLSEKRPSPLPLGPDSVSASPSVSSLLTVSRFQPVPVD